MQSYGSQLWNSHILRALITTLLVVWTPSAASLNTARVLYNLQHKSLVNEEMSQRQYILKSFLLSQRLRILLEHSWKLLLLGHIHKTLQLIKHHSYKYKYLTCGTNNELCLLTTTWNSDHASSQVTHAPSMGGWSASWAIAHWL